MPPRWSETRIGASWSPAAPEIARPSTGQSGSAFPLTSRCCARTRIPRPGRGSHHTVIAPPAPSGTLLEPTRSTSTGVGPGRSTARANGAWSAAGNRSSALRRRVGGSFMTHLAGCGSSAVVGSASFRLSVLRFLDHHAVDAVHLHQLHADDLLLRGGDVLANEVGADRQLAMPAVDHH